MRSVFVLAGLVLSRLSFAADAETFQLRGWTQDGVYFVYEDWVTLVEHDAPVAIEDAQVAFVVDARTGVATRYYLSLARSEDETPEAKRTLDAVTVRKKEFGAWHRAHPTSCRFGRTSPDGAATAEVALGDERLGGKWKGDAFYYAFAGDDPTEGILSEVRLSVLRGGKRWPSSHFTAQGGFAGQAPEGNVRACWSPTSKRVAWLAHSTLKTMRDHPFTTAVLGPAGGPRIELRAHKSVLEQLLPPVAAALEQAGFAPSASRAADEARPKTIIYSTAAVNDVAQKLAQAVPGGASVEPITWKSPNADIIVAIGASAQASGK